MNTINMSDESDDSDYEFVEIPNKKPKHSKEFNKRNELESEKLLESFCASREYKKVDENPTDLLDSDEEIYLVQMCKNLDPHLLIEEFVAFDRPTKLKLNGEVYMWNVNTQNTPEIDILNYNNLARFEPKGIVTVQRHFKSKKKSIELNDVKDTVNFPENLKTRHPLFGTDYKKEIKLDKGILEKLTEEIADVSKKAKKKSKEKCIKIIENVRVDDLDIIKLLNEHERQTKKESEHEDKKKKKKKKHKEVDERNSLGLSPEVFPNITKRKKKKKEHQEELEVVEQFSVHEDKDERCQDLNANEYLTSPKIIEDDAPKKKKKKKERASMVNSTMLPSKINDTILHLDESYIPKEKKKKYSHRDSIDTFIDDIVKDVTLSEWVEKRKKTKRKRSFSDEIEQPKIKRSK